MKFACLRILNGITLLLVTPTPDSQDVQSDNWSGSVSSSTSSSRLWTDKLYQSELQNFIVLHGHNDGIYTILPLLTVLCIVLIDKALECCIAIMAV